MNPDTLKNSLRERGKDFRTVIVTGLALIVGIGLSGGFAGSSNPQPAPHSIAIVQNAPRQYEKFTVIQKTPAKPVVKPANQVPKPAKPKPIAVKPKPVIKPKPKPVISKPKPVAKSVKGIRYVVQPGDTLSAIGARYGVTYQSIARANGILNPDVISIGQVLVIPTENSGDILPVPDPVTDYVQSYPPGYLLPANYRTIVNFLLNHGYTRNAACGIAGNIYRESLGNPEAVGTGGAGLIGWTPPHPGLVTGNPSVDLQNQLEHILQYNAIWSGYIPALNAASSPEAAAYIYCYDFERPGIPALYMRQQSARAVYNAMFG